MLPVLPVTAAAGVNNIFGWVHADPRAFVTRVRNASDPTQIPGYTSTVPGSPFVSYQRKRAGNKDQAVFANTDTTAAQVSAWMGAHGCGMWGRPRG